MKRQKEAEHLLCFPYFRFSHSSLSLSSSKYRDAHAPHTHKPAIYFRLTQEFACANKYIEKLLRETYKSETGKNNGELFERKNDEECVHRSQLNWNNMVLHRLTLLFGIIHGNLCAPTKPPHTLISTQCIVVVVTFFLWFSCFLLIHKHWNYWHEHSIKRAPYLANPIYAGFCRRIAWKTNKFTCSVDGIVGDISETEMGWRSLRTNWCGKIKVFVVANLICHVYAVCVPFQYNVCHGSIYTWQPTLHNGKSTLIRYITSCRIYWIDRTRSN